MQIHEKTKRLHETPEPFWKNLFENWCATLAIISAIIGWILVILFLETNDAGGGFGSRALTTKYFNWHPLMMATGFLLLMIPAVLSFELFPFLRHTNKNWHGLLNTLSFISILAGYAVIVDCHANLGSHGLFKSVHSFVGFSAIVLVTLNYLAAFFLYVVKLGGELRGSLKPLHKRVGFVALLLGLCSICIGVQETSTLNSYEGTTLHIGYGIAMCAIVALLGIVFSVAKFVDKNDPGVQYMSAQADDPENNYML